MGGIVLSFFQGKLRLPTIQGGDDLPFWDKLPLQNLNLLEVAFPLHECLDFRKCFQLAGGIDQVVETLPLCSSCPDFGRGDLISKGFGGDFLRTLFGFGTGEHRS